MVIVTKAEESIMRILWDKSPRTLEEVAGEICREHYWSEHAVGVLLTRLIRKGAVTRWKGGEGAVAYVPAISPAEMKMGYTRGIWEKLTDNEAILLVNSQKPVKLRRRKDRDS